MASYHTRSLSFPSKAHPIVDQFDEHMCRLRSSQAASTSSTQKLTDLKDLYSYVDELLQLPLNQQAISQNLNSKWVEEVLDGSLRLIDMCTTSRDVLVQSKECLQDIQSVLRRRCSGELNLTNEIVQYINTRKSAMKLIKKCLKNIKKEEKTNKDDIIESMLKDVEAISLDVFKSVLSYIGGAKLESQKSKWSLVHRKVKETRTEDSQFDAVDATFESVVRQKKYEGENMRSQIIVLESEIQVLEEALGSLFRQLVKTRATLLNILSN